PEDPTQRAAFQAYMEHGGAWMGFHFAGFALTPSAYPANWDWYHNSFLGSGSYVSNTWRPTSAILRVEDRNHPATAHLPETFRSEERRVGKECRVWGSAWYCMREWATRCEGHCPSNLLWRSR